MNIIDQLPSTSDKRIALHVKPAAERAIRRGHPWVFEESIRKQSHQGGSGDLAVIFDHKDRFLAIGLFDPESTIRVRVLQKDRPEKIDLSWFQKRIKAAIIARDPIREGGTNGYRLVNGENDGLPGLVIDRYGDHCVLKIYTLAWLPYLTTVLVALDRNFQTVGQVLRLSRSIKKMAGDLYGLQDGQVLRGDPITNPILFKENGFSFEADLLRGQKTGFFLDQRENRARCEALARQDPSIQNVLNVFAYTGAFSLYVARGGATSVWSLDKSGLALEQAGQHFQINHHWPGVAAARHRVIEGDAFQVMEQLRRQEKRFDLLIVDPPSLASSQKSMGKAMRAYKNLARLAIPLIRGGGKLVMSSCTARVNPREFYETIEGLASEIDRPLRGVSKYGHARDHPVAFPEGAYLKCLFGTVS